MKGTVGDLVYDGKSNIFAKGSSSREVSLSLTLVAKLLWFISASQTFPTGGMIKPASHWNMIPRNPGWVKPRDVDKDSPPAPGDPGPGVLRKWVGWMEKQRRWMEMEKKNPCSETTESQRVAREFWDKNECLTNMFLSDDATHGIKQMILCMEKRPRTSQGHSKVMALIIEVGVHQFTHLSNSAECYLYYKAPYKGPECTEFPGGTVG